MTADHSSDQGSQRTVAELLAQYGGDGARSGSRRRRRAADDDDEPGTPGNAGAPGTRAPVNGGAPGNRAPGGHRSNGRDDTGASGALFPQTAPPPPPAKPAVPEQRWASGAGYGQSIDPLTGEPIDQPPGRAGSDPRGAGPEVRRGRTDSPSMSAPSTAFVPPPPGPARQKPTARTDPPTEQLARYPKADGGPVTGPMTGPMTGPVSWRAGGNAVEPDNGPPTGQVAKADLLDEREEAPLAGAAPAGLAERDDRGAFADRVTSLDVEEDEPEQEDTPLGVKGWLALVAQWVVGAIVGALLWVGFSYLWTHQPVVALVAAVLATAGLVLLVRAIRRSDDLQTTMLAVLVGLVVTISPAVLLLAAR